MNLLELIQETCGLLYTVVIESPSPRGYTTSSMLSVSHSLTGAFIASQLPHPLLYIPLTLGAHYLEDWIPHWDVGTGLSNGTRKRSTAILLEFVDLAVTIGLVYFFFQMRSPAILWHVWLGAFVALVPDFMEAPRNFFKWEPGFLKPLNNFHHWFHHSTPNKIVGIMPQLITVALIYFLK
jgi:hypothetical protein